nr:MAG TPA: hypothetical protein [Caudoviricetes sp.]
MIPLKVTRPSPNLTLVIILSSPSRNLFRFSSNCY